MFIDWFLFAAQWAQAALKIHIVHTFLFFDRIENSEKAIVMERIKTKLKENYIQPSWIKTRGRHSHYGKDFIQKEIQIILFYTIYIDYFIF